MLVEESEAFRELGKGWKGVNSDDKAIFGGSGGIRGGLRRFEMALVANSTLRLEVWFLTSLVGLLLEDLLTRTNVFTGQTRNITKLCEGFW